MRWLGLMLLIAAMAGCTDPPPQTPVIMVDVTALDGSPLEEVRITEHEDGTRSGNSILVSVDGTHVPGDEVKLIWLSQAPWGDVLTSICDMDAGTPCTDLDAPIKYQVEPPTNAVSVLACGVRPINETTANCKAESSAHFEIVTEYTFDPVTFEGPLDGPDNSSCDQDENAQHVIKQFAGDGWARSITFEVVAGNAALVICQDQEPIESTSGSIEVNCPLPTPGMDIEPTYRCGSWWDLSISHRSDTTNPVAVNEVIIRAIATY